MLCPVCQASFPTWEGWKAHVSGHTDGKRHPCSVQFCYRAFTQKAAVNKHVASFHEGWRWCCPVCDAVYKDSANFYDHLKKPANVNCVGSKFVRRQIGERHDMAEFPVPVIANDGPMEVIIPAPVVRPSVAAGGGDGVAGVVGVVAGVEGKCIYI